MAQRSIEPLRRSLWWLPWLAGCGLFFGIEVYSHVKAGQGTSVPLRLILGADVDTLVWGFLLAAAPLVWWVAGKGVWRRGRETASVLTCGFASRVPKAVRAPLLSLFVGAVSLVVSAYVGARFDRLPPAFHDEFSYLIQAETFLAGRTSFPSHEGARLFDQMHVLNEGRFASRYFPGAGLWMAPFVALGHPYWGHWLAGALCAVFVFWSGREVAGDMAGLIGGLLTALSPGMALFSNLLLAHHPTLVGLGLFLLGWLRMVRLGSRAWGFAAGIGLAFAMLCRPLTAAGVALPFGIYLVFWMARRDFGVDSRARPADNAQRHQGADAPRSPGRIATVAALAIPLVAGMLGLFWYDRSITGSGWVTPYSLYIDIYTPRHVYGFNNVVRGERRLGPKVIDNYDQWAENLTLELAVENERQRLMASSIWALGLIPLTLSLVAGFVLWNRVPRGAWLVLAGILSLHAAYFPYWYVGIDYYHYVFESLPLWALWTGVVSVVAAHELRLVGRSAVGWWWGAVLTAAVLMNFTVGGGTWSAPLESGIRQVLFARTKHGRFRDLVAREARPLPALVLVEADPADRHIEYVTNPADLSGPVLIGHFIPEKVPLAEVKRLFPDRALFLYRARDESWSRLD